MNTALRAILDLGDVAWQRDAKCAGQPTGIFFSNNALDRRRAKAICAGCSVREECLEFALRVPIAQDTLGVYGGTTASERKAERSRRRTRRGANA